MAFFDADAPPTFSLFWLRVFGKRPLAAQPGVDIIHQGTELVALDRSSPSASSETSVRPPRVVTAPSPTAAAQTSKQQQEEVTVSIRVVLVRLVLGVLAPMLVVVAAFGIWNIQLQRETVNSNLLDTARSLALNIDRDLDTVQASLRTLALSANLQAGDLAAFHGQAIEAAKPFGGWIILVERGGRQLVNTRLPYGSTLPDVQLPQLTEHAFTTGEPQVSPLFIGGVTKKPVIAVSVPVFLNGKVAYDLRIGFLPERFAHLLSLAGKPAGWAAFLFDGERQIIGQWGPDEEKSAPVSGRCFRPGRGKAAKAKVSITLSTWDPSPSPPITIHSCPGGQFWLRRQSDWWIGPSPVRRQSLLAARLFLSCWRSPPRC